MKLHRESLITKLILAVVLATALTSLAVALASLRITGRHLRRQLEQELPHDVHQLKARIEAWYENRRLEMQAFANSAFMFGALRQLQELPARSPQRQHVQAELGKYLNYISEPFDYYEGFFLFDRAGTLIAQSGQAAVAVLGDDLFRQVAGREPSQTEILPVWFGPELHAPHQFILSSVRDHENHLLGLLVGAIRLEKLQEFFRDPELAPTAEFIVVNPAGQLILLSRESAPVAPDRNPSFQRKLQHQLAESGNRLLEYRDPTGRRVVGAITEIPPLGWLMAEKDYDSAFAPLSTIRNRTLILVILILIGFSVLAWRGLHSLLRPIEELARGVEAISSDQLDIYLPSPSGDEIGRLTRSFNRMAQRLRINRLEIERSQQNLADINLRLEQANVSLAEKNYELENANLKLAKLAITDHLTGLYNLRNLSSILEREMARARRSQEPLSLLMIDIDDFKRFNDEYGHSAGDALLKEIAAIFQESVRQTDFIGRFGGEEFLAVLPDTGKAGARGVGEKIRAAVDQKRFRISGVRGPIRQTVSVGAATLSADDRSGLSQVQFINRSDKALYQAKRLGKNRMAEYED